MNIYHNKAHQAAVEYFKSIGAWFEGCVIHHIDPTLKDKDLKRYAEWRPEDLEVLSVGEHTKKHMELGSFDASHERKRGKKLTEETKQKIRARAKCQEHPKGKHWYTNGVEDTQAFECPENWWAGRTNANAFTESRPPEVGAKISAKKKGVKPTEEHRKKLSDVRIERALAKGGKNPAAKRVLCIETGVVYDYIGACLKVIGVTRKVFMKHLDRQMAIDGYHYRLLDKGEIV